MRMRWWARHSLQTQPCTYAALVPCSRSSRRAAVSAVSSFSDHSGSVLASPHTWLEVTPGHDALPETAGRHRSRRGAVGASRQVAVLAPCAGSGPSLRRSEPGGIGCSYIPHSTASWCVHAAKGLGRQDRGRSANQGPGRSVPARPLVRGAGLITTWCSSDRSNRRLCCGRRVRCSCSGQTRGNP